MSKKPRTRSFSIFLLKEGYDVDAALVDEHEFSDELKANKLPKDSRFFLKRGDSRPPWWSTLFDIEDKPFSATNSGMLFLPVDERLFAVSFGHGKSLLRPEAYEYDFGIRTTLNCIDPDQLKSMDGLEPSGGRRRRTQVASLSNVSAFDFDQDASLLKSLTGKVRPEYADLFKHLSGADNVRVSAGIEADGLPDLCSKLLELYNKEDFKESFPELRNVSPVRDPDIVGQLDAKLLEALHTSDDGLSLSVPEIVDHQRSGFWVAYHGLGRGKQYDDASLEEYFLHLEERGKPLADLTIDDIKHHKMQLIEEDHQPRSDKYSVYKCLIFDTKLDGDDAVYHLCEGEWYNVAGDFVSSLSAFIDPYCIETSLLPYNHKDEADYNASAASNHDMVCLDTKSISPSGKYPVEPCDIFGVSDGVGTLYHVKRGTSSSSLSHLFNQGANSIRLLREDDPSVEKLKKLIQDGAGHADYDEVCDPQKLRVSLAIVTRKKARHKSENLPLFSRISLQRVLKDMRLYGVDTEVCFIQDDSQKKSARKSKNKPKPQADAAPEGS